MSIIGKNKSVLEKIVKIEESDRCKCGYMYEITVKSNNGRNSEIREKTLYVDLNHRFTLENGKIIFKKNKKPGSDADWDYNKEPFEIVAIGIMPESPENKAYIRMFNSFYKEQEDLWKANCNKEEHDDCVACESSPILNSKNLLL